MRAMRVALCALLAYLACVHASPPTPPRTGDDGGGGRAGGRGGRAGRGGRGRAGGRAGRARGAGGIAKPARRNSRQEDATNDLDGPVLYCISCTCTPYSTNDGVAIADTPRMECCAAMLHEFHADFLMRVADGQVFRNESAPAPWPADSDVVALCTGQMGRHGA